MGDILRELLLNYYLFSTIFKHISVLISIKLKLLLTRYTTLLFNVKNSIIILIQF